MCKMIEEQRPRSRRGEAAVRYLVLWLGLEAAEDGVLVGEGIERHGCLISALPARGVDPGRLNWDRRRSWGPRSWFC
jgi:hypothetical protein